MIDSDNAYLVEANEGTKTDRTPETLSSLVGDPSFFASWKNLPSTSTPIDDDFEIKLAHQSK